MTEAANPQDTTARAARAPPAGQGHCPLPIVAIGASAGGLEAVSTLLDSLPQTTGFAFILVQHLDPNHKSLMVELLAKHTAMPVIQATEGCMLTPNRFHVIPPGRFLSVRAGALHLSPQQASYGARLPFDFLLGSLAASGGQQTVCVILSGSGRDGSGGLCALKAAGGHVIAQDPATADYDGMPRSAITTGLVDQILPLADIPRALADLAEQISRGPSRHEAPGVSPPSAPQVPRSSPPSELPLSGLKAIVAFLKEKTAHDFGQYKPGTLERRIERRMALLAIAPGDLAAYLEFLRQDPAECALLDKDLLINVTRFFRDSKVFDLLQATTIPEIIRALPAKQALRVWVAGCSTGEEAYSLAMICRDAIEASGQDIPLQVFASDIDADAIAVAREGMYPFDIAGAITADRLARYFIRDEAGYRVKTALRGDVVFTVHDVLSDPPFSRVDLVSCRNVLIYLNPEAQAKVISTFHFALCEGGLLLLGPTETVGSAGDRFAIVAKSARIYRNAARSQPGKAGVPAGFAAGQPAVGNADRTAHSPREATLAEICRTAVLASHAPAAILINRKRQCLFSTGPIDRYLRIAPGYATHDLLLMATPALRTKLRLGIDKVSKTNPCVAGGRTRLTRDGATIWFRIDVQSIAGDDDLLLVCFVEETGKSAAAPAAASRSDKARVVELERELEATQAELQTSILNQQTLNQEQKTINEEALSVNEEFQSTNEELLTSKEELQSLNEELTALNSQLQETLEGQRLASDDLQNVLYSTNVGTLFLDMNLKIRFYTPAIKSLFSMIASDIGRPLADLQPIAVDDDLLADARRVLKEEALIEREVSAPDNVWFARRIFPYRAHNNRVEGVVITFADVTERKSIAKALGDAKAEAERANLAKSRFLAAASHDLRQPLQSLTLLQELLVRSVEGEVPQKLLARFEQTLGAMSGMLNALLDINQIEAGVVEAKPTAFRMAEVLDTLRGEFAYLAQARGLSLRILPSAAVVQSDPRLLEQMLRNLIGNALKYTAHGRILLGCRRRGDTLRIEIWDTGIGIAADQLHLIFDEFHQADNIARERSRGLGLGLSIVQRLGRLLGHDVDVQSAPGRGSVFAVTVSLAPTSAAKAVAVAVPSSAAAAPAHQLCKIVIVDDDPDVLDLLEQLLKASGHIVRTAADGDAAIKMIMGGAIMPEILLTDYNLPGGMNGLELIAKLRAQLPQGLRAIILTGDISSETLATIAAEDCQQLSKPIRPHELALAIDRLSPQRAPLLAAPASASIGGSVPIIFIIDDEPEVRLSIRDVLESDGRLVEDFASSEAFLEAYRNTAEGCLLIDVNLPGMNGVALLENMRARGDQMPAILITASSDIGLAVEAMRKGACDFIEKPVGRAALLASIARALDLSRGLRVIDLVHEEAAALVANLTLRQREIMQLVLAGHPSKNIAADLGISQRTVENHRAAIMHRMGAKSLPELARTALAATAPGRPQEVPADAMADRR